MDFKKIFLGSVIAMGAFGLIACGDDSSTNSNGENEQHKVFTPDTTTNDAIISSIGSLTAIDPAYPSTIMRFTGVLQLDLTSSESDSSQSLTFKRPVSLSVVKKEANGSLKETNVLVSADTTKLPAIDNPTKIDFGPKSANVTVDLNDAGFTECGDFALYIKLAATDGIKNFKSEKIIDFKRDDSYCTIETPSSSSTEPSTNEIAMASCIVEGLSTNVKPGISLATCQGVDAGLPADIVFHSAGKLDNPDMTLSSDNGYLFNILSDDKYEVNAWPETSRNPPVAYKSDFVYAGAIDKASIEELIVYANRIYVAAAPATFNDATGDGFYAFAINSHERGNGKNTNFSVKIYYKAP